MPSDRAEIRIPRYDSFLFEHEDGAWIQHADHLREVERLRGLLRDVDATLCACRHYPSPEGCNCDIHAAHRLINAELGEK